MQNGAAKIVCLLHTCRAFVFCSSRRLHRIIWINTKLNGFRVGCCGIISDNQQQSPTQHKLSRPNIEDVHESSHNCECSVWFFLRNWPMIKLLFPLSNLGSCCDFVTKGVHTTKIFSISGCRENIPTRERQRERVRERANTFEHKIAPLKRKYVERTSRLVLRRPVCWFTSCELPLKY